MNKTINRMILVFKIVMFTSIVSAQISTNYEGNTVGFSPTSVGNENVITVQITSEIAQVVTLAGHGLPFTIDDESLSLDVDETAYLQFSFSPNEVGVFLDTVNVTGSIFGSLDLYLQGEGTQVDIDVEVEALGFGEVALGQSETQFFNLSNEGTGTLQVFNITPDNNQFTVDQNSLNLDTGESVAINVTYAPTLTGNTSGTISIESDDPNDPVVTLLVQGIGVSNISGDVSGIWLAENSPYYIVSDTYVQDSDSLTIEDGTEIIFTGSYEFEIQGSLFFDGDEDTTKFLGNNGQAHLVIDNANNEIEFNNCYFGPNQFEVQTNIDFESQTDLAGWSFDGGSESGISTGQYYSGSGSAYIYRDNSGSCYIRSPNFTASSNEPVVDFWWRTDWYNYYDWIFIIRICNATTGSNSDLYSYTYDQTTWQNASYNLSDYVNEGDQFYIELESYAQYWGYMWIDDFEITNVSGTGTGPGIEVKIKGSNNHVTFNHCQLKNSWDQGLDLECANSTINLLNTTIDNPLYAGIDIESGGNNIGLLSGSTINDAMYGIYASTSSTITVNHSLIEEITEHGIYQNANGGSVYLWYSDIKNTGGDGIFVGNGNTSVTLIGSSIDSSGGYGIYTTGANSAVSLDSSFITNASNTGIYTADSYSPITCVGSTINNNDGNGISTSSTYSLIEIDSSKIINNSNSGVKSVGNYSGAIVHNSIIKDNGHHGVYASYYPGIATQTLIANNGSTTDHYGFYAGNYVTGQNALIDFSTIIDNEGYGYYLGNTTNTYIKNSIIWNNNNGNSQSSSSFDVSRIYFSSIQNVGNTYDPQLIDDLGHVANTSPTVDAADPYYSDNYFPPGQGELRADMGVYGGPNNDVWGVGGPPLNGQPIINHIVDLPQDQGGFVGVMYQGSLFDYENYAHDITNYEFWRAMELSRNEGAPDTTLETIMRTHEIYWEYVGQMQAEGFESYGFSASTLGDSTASSGIFWSKYIVIANTSLGETFISQPDSGYSVDNIAPYAPATVQGLVNENGELNVVWEIPENEDIAYYNVFRNEQLLLSTAQSSFSDQLSLGENYTYTIQGIDVNENIGEMSEGFTFDFGMLGDITWDGAVDVLDIIQIASVILNGSEEFSEFQLWASELNNDGIIDIFDLTLIVDIIMGYNSTTRSVSNDQNARVYVESNIVYLRTESAIRGMEFDLISGVRNIENMNDLELTHKGNKVLIYSMNDNHLIGDDIPLFFSDENIQLDKVKAAGRGGSEIEVSLGILPGEFLVHQNYPNPFNPSTSIKIDVPKKQYLSLDIYDLSGRNIQNLHQGNIQPGHHKFIWDGSDRSGVRISSGIYLIRVSSGKDVQTVKAMFIQ